MNGSPAPAPALSVRIRLLDSEAPRRWLEAGWRDMVATPAVSLSYGGALVAASYLITVGLLKAELGSLVLPLVGGLALVAPILVVGLYEVSRRRESGEAIGLRSICIFCLRNGSQVAAMGMVLLLVFLAWALLAIGLFALFFGEAPPPPDRFAEVLLAAPHAGLFLFVGTVTGGILACGIFAITAVSIPFLLDQDEDVVTAARISVTAVLANWRVMTGWAATIAVVVFSGVVTFYLGLGLALPVLAYASWHAYRDTLEITRPSASPPSSGG